MSACEEQKLTSLVLLPIQLPQQMATIRVHEPDHAIRVFEEETGVRFYSNRMPPRLRHNSRRALRMNHRAIAPNIARRDQKDREAYS